MPAETKKRKNHPNSDTCNKGTKKPSSSKTVFGNFTFFRGQMNSFFDNTSLINFSATSTSLHSATQPEMEKLHAAAHKLLEHVLFGEQDKAEIMIIAQPELLSIKSRAMDYSGRTIFATPFQAAIGAGDQPMWEMMLPYMEHQNALWQFDEWYPNGIKETPASELQPHYNRIARASWLGFCGAVRCGRDPLVTSALLEDFCRAKSDDALAELREALEFLTSPGGSPVNNTRQI